MVDVELDARVTALEENGGGSIQNGNKITRTYVSTDELGFYTAAT